MTNTNIYAKRIFDTLQARQERVQWETFIVEMLQKLELSLEERARATKRYEALGAHVALIGMQLAAGDVAARAENGVQRQGRDARQSAPFLRPPRIV